MATKQIINQENVGNNSVEKSTKGERKINTKKTADRISTELWMEHFANVLLKENAIDEKTYRKLMAKISKEVNRRFANR